MSASQPLSKVFITHSWHDIEFTRRLCSDLKARGLDVWYDEESLQAGSLIAKEIDRGLKWCEFYIPILSHAALSSDWCWEEINGAIALSNRRGIDKRLRIIPVLAENCEDEMPTLLLSRVYINFTERYDEALNELLHRGFRMGTAETRLPASAETPSERSA
jgi:hypothetical protein